MAVATHTDGALELCWRLNQGDEIGDVSVQPLAAKTGEAQPL